MTNPKETRLARFERTAPDLLEIRLEPGIRIDGPAIADIMRERIRLCGNAPLCVLVLVARDAELDIAVMGMDHYQENQSAQGLRAVALVSEVLLLETMARLYVAYFPPMFKLEVFNKEAEARHWLDEQRTALRQAGQKV